MTGSPYGPDRPCQRTPCVAANQLAEQDARERAIAAGDDPVDVLADPLPTVGDHLGGAHLDPHDREHYDGVRAMAMPGPVREATRPLMGHVSAYDSPTPDDTALRVHVDVALDACFREIDRLRQQVAHAQVDADRKVRDASRAALDCAAHGEMIRQTEAQAENFARAAERHEKARLVLLGFLTTVDDWLDARGKAVEASGTEPHTQTQIADALAKASRKTHAAHARAWKD